MHVLTNHTPFLAGLAAMATAGGGTSTGCTGWEYRLVPKMYNGSVTDPATYQFNATGEDTAPFTEGRLEVRPAGETNVTAWGTVKLLSGGVDAAKDRGYAQHVCGVLGYSDAAKSYHRVLRKSNNDDWAGPGVGKLQYDVNPECACGWVDGVQKDCQADASYLRLVPPETPLNHEDDITLSCAGTKRAEVDYKYRVIDKNGLTDASDSSHTAKGRLEISKDGGTTWGSVCYASIANAGARFARRACVKAGFPSTNSFGAYQLTKVKSVGVFDGTKYTNDNAAGAGDNAPSYHYARYLWAHVPQSYATKPIVQQPITCGCADNTTDSCTWDDGKLSVCENDVDNHVVVDCDRAKDLPADVTFRLATSGNAAVADGTKVGILQAWAPPPVEEVRMAPSSAPGWVYIHKDAITSAGVTAGVALCRAFGEDTYTLSTGFTEDAEPAADLLVVYDNFKGVATVTSPTAFTLPSGAVVRDGSGTASIISSGDADMLIKLDCTSVDGRTGNRVPAELAKWGVRLVESRFAAPGPILRRGRLELKPDGANAKWGSVTTPALGVVTSSTVDALLACKAAGLTDTESGKFISDYGMAATTDEVDYFTAADTPNAAFGCDVTKHSLFSECEWPGYVGNVENGDGVPNHKAALGLECTQPAPTPVALSSWEVRLNSSLPDMTARGCPRTQGRLEVRPNATATWGLVDPTSAAFFDRVMRICRMLGLPSTSDVQWKSVDLDSHSATGRFRLRDLPVYTKVPDCGWCADGPAECKWGVEGGTVAGQADYQLQHTHTPVTAALEVDCEPGPDACVPTPEEVENTTESEIVPSNDTDSPSVDLSGSAGVPVPAAALLALFAVAALF